MSKSLKLALSLAAVMAASPVWADKLGLGRPAVPEEIEAWDVVVLPDGRGLPEGSGDVSTGEEVFAEKCAMCHGDFAEGIDNWPVLAGGQGTLTDRRPVKTIGSYWPYLSTVWDYIHRSMPFGAAQTVTPDETYAITAFLLYSNGLVDEDFVLSKENFTEIHLPNENGFYPDDRAEVEYPKFRVEPCMTDCKGEVKITKRAADLKVTPTDPDGRPAGTIPDWFEVAQNDTAPEAPADEAQAEPAAEAEATAMAAPDPALVAAGEKVFRKCKACHKVGEGAKNGTGPVLNGVVGRPAAAVDGFKYSNAMKAAAEDGLVWTPENLHEYLAAPKKFIKGTKMSFAGLKKPEDIDAVIAYLSTFGG
ncbi:cytochrome c [Albidovulum inexpectatum]|uniref:Cytochrome c n=1 Tax=Albidovulum inexpectatum TaxID=196587 RepID=A0A2S5JEA9_9RHOB|nr:c-type cytochrome [Albidovulum inexpectatum]PPB79729.1 cytochrome c [Albidovulum inexpectatum]